MESWCVAKYNSSLLIFMMLLFSLVGWIQGTYVEDERKALLEIKASLHESSYFLKVDHLLPTWVDHGGEYCDWERIMCDTASGHVTGLSLSNIFSMEDISDENYDLHRRGGMIWSLDVSLFLPFRELRKLDLSLSYIGNTFAKTGLERLSDLKKLENLNLSTNFIETNIFPSLSELTSLKILDLSYSTGYTVYGPKLSHDISAFQISENLEVLNLTGCGYHGTLQMQGSVSTLTKLEILNLGDNHFNETLVPSLTELTSLKVLDLQFNHIAGLFPSEELSHLTNMEKLDLSLNNLNATPSTQGCKSLMRLEKLESVYLSGSNFNKSIISCLRFLPSLKNLDLHYSFALWGSFFPMQELSSLSQLTTLDLSFCRLESLTLNGTMSNLVHLNLEMNKFFLVDDIMRSMAAFPSLRFLSLHSSGLEGRLFANELPSLPDLEVLILNDNFLNGELPIEALASFHHLEVLDLSNNKFVGSIPSTIKQLSSLKVVSFAYNKLNGSLSNNGLCELKNIHEMDLSGNVLDGSLPECFKRLSSLKFFDISANQFTGKLLPSMIANFTSLEYIDFSHNKFEGLFSFSLFSNHTKLEFVSFKSDNGKFEVETEEPTGWTPMFQLKVLMLSNCNINRPKGSIFPHFLLHQHKLKQLDMSHNSLEGQFPNWLIDNNTMLEFLHLRNNSLGNAFCMPIYTNPNTRWLDVSGNHMTGAISTDIQKFLPYITQLNLSMNSLAGDIPSSVSDFSELSKLDLSHNELSGEVPIGLITNLSLFVLKLSNNSLHGEVLSGHLPYQWESRIHLDSNYFTGKIRQMASNLSALNILDISNNFFTGFIPEPINVTGEFSSLLFLDISRNNFSGPIPSCLHLQSLKHLHLGSNMFTGSIPTFFRNLTDVLTLDVGNNHLSDRIPEFLGELSSLRILLLRNNIFSGSIPRQLCWLTNISLIDLSNNFLSGSIPGCLQNISGPTYQAFIHTEPLDGRDEFPSNYRYLNDLEKWDRTPKNMFIIQDEVLFTTKTLSLAYKGEILDIMSGLDLSSNKLTGAIPDELGLLIQIHALNLSHNRLTGPIPVKLSNLVSIESLDLSSNNLTGKVPSELINLNSLEVFNVSFNNLSGKLPEMKAQFGTFSKDSYQGNPLLCGPPLETCTTGRHESRQSIEEGNDGKWYDMDMTSFYGSSGSTWFVFMLGFATLLWVNPYWRRRWLDLVEECMYTCYYFFSDLVRKVFMLCFK